MRLLHGTDLVCEVFDGSLTMPRIRRATDTDEGGRGLQLVSALAHRWGTRYTATGKCIWTEQPVDGSGILPGFADADGAQILPGFADFDGDLDKLPFGDDW
jgi:hypothetical protein